MIGSTLPRLIMIIVLIAILIIVLVGIIKIKGCNNVPETIVGTISMPRDTNYTPIENRTYQPASVPFLSNKTSGVKLPSGVKEKDVRKVTSFDIEVSPGKLKRVDAIETKDGQLFVGKDSVLKNVTVTTFEDPVFSFGMSYGLGVSSSLNEHPRISPSGVISFMNWNVGGLNFKAPSAVIDLDGIGPGVSMQVYHDFYLGAFHEWKYDSGTQIKATLSIMF